MNFAADHIASLLKYTGISFTAGAVTHGFFSEERSLWTAVAGVALYLMGSALEKSSNPSEGQSWTAVLGIGILASIGLGFFTGGLQHFPDSPARSVWVVPLGFLMSLVAGYALTARGRVPMATVVRYGVISCLVVTLASLYAYERLHDDHAHDGHHETHGRPGHGHRH